MGARIYASLMCALFASSAWGQWAAINLSQPSWSFSGATAAAGVSQGGFVPMFDRPVPAIWQGSAGSWLSLAQNPGDNGFLYGMDGVHQVGQLNGHASLWSGTPQSRVDLNPAGFLSSVANAVWGNEQAGVAETNTDQRAAVWHGSSASFVNLHPPGAVQSVAKSCAAGQQGGIVYYSFPGGGTVDHAALWSGSAASFIDLNPSFAQSSAIQAIWPGQQVGGYTVEHGGSFAAIWHGTPESVVSLHPAGAGYSAAWGTCGSAQVGIAGLGRPSAVIWFGTAASCVNLGDFLPGGYIQSMARAVTFYNGQYYVVGQAMTAEGVNEAYLWVGIPAPGSAATLVAAGLLAVRRRRA